MNKLEIGEHGTVFVNGVRISCINNFKLEMSGEILSSVSMDFDVSEVSPYDPENKTIIENPTKEMLECFSTHDLLAELTERKVLTANFYPVQEMTRFHGEYDGLLHVDKSLMEGGSE